jgi:hypothetical protein
MSGGNGRNMSGEFPLWLKFGDVEMMYDVMQYGLTRLMFGGEKNSKEAIERFTELFEQIKAMSPLPEKARNRGASAFFDAFRAVETCDAFEVFVEKGEGSLDEAVISVLVHEAGEVARFDLTHWLKVPDDAKGRKPARSLEEAFEENVERLADMLVQTSPVSASRVVEHRVRLLVDEDTETWRDEFEVAMAQLCLEMFGPEVEFRKYDYTSKGHDQPGFLGVDLIVAVPTVMLDVVEEKARSRNEDFVAGDFPESASI